MYATWNGRALKTVLHKYNRLMSNVRGSSMPKEVRVKLFTTDCVRFACLLNSYTRTDTRSPVSAIRLTKIIHCASVTAMRDIL